MAIYRPPKPRWRAAVSGGLVGLLLGASIGFALGRPNEPDLVEAAGAIRASLARSAGSLEVAAIEYSEAVEDGDIVAQAEYEGALGAVSSSEAAYGDVRPALADLAPDKVAAIDAAFEELYEAMNERADEALVEQMATRLEVMLKE